MKEFRFVNYHTEYSCEGSIVKKMDREACFSYAFYEVENDSKVHYKIILRRGIDFCKQQNASNACFFDQREVKNHVKQLANLYPIKSKVTKNDEDNTFIVELDLEQVPASFHKYALTWVRYLYEYPYNVILKDAYKLKKESQFRFESIANLFNLGIACFCDGIREIHQVPQNRINERLSTAKLKERISQVRRLNDIYKKLKNKTLVIPREIGDYNVDDVEYWENDQAFEQRKQVYITVYNKNFKKK